MQNLQGRRPKIKPFEFFGLILEPTAKIYGQWLICTDIFCNSCNYLSVLFGSEIYFNHLII